MKWLFLLFFPSLCFAKEYHFYYRMDIDGKTNTLEYKTDAPDWATAHHRGMIKCADFFVDRLPPTEESKWDVFDVCENPRDK